MSFLTPQQFQQFRQAVNGVFDTFAKVGITYVQGSPRLDRWGEEPLKGTEIDLNVYPTFDPTESDEDEYGSEDVSEGTLLVKYDELLSKGLIDANKHLLLDAERDHLHLYGVKYRITYVTNKAVIDDTPSYVEIGVRRGPEKH